MFLQGNTFAPEKACPDGQSRRRRDFHTKGKRRGKKGDLPVAGAKKDSRAALHGTARLRALPYRCHVCSPHSYRYLLL
ncbi:hypothetical protein M107_5110 [Bacteroides fragilis str. 3725 D9(v)]|uniref:Uncharacterized protein n=1 Tax=Bacteroides ovatus TaxID=28116 RepID=A0AAP9DH87_BACOV|nr:hypothetical protein M107_5110 [Bacteroides fragilis str. 3725 D9(v)]KDS20235.1 hypothetical protein M082_2253 [Bacteroides fragilis str. 3725 D9 ii]KDS32882.1 hypothetical protein M089_3753 [Bacteroides ovatus str. 3725 D9 iii]QCQ31377.1 hypothetical protein IB64_006865 [Bacteroides fragilis]QDM08663.1 hypothetical protein DYI28_07940 [Bacteroides ovatus]QUR43576.1 hypothetical protein FQN58_10275 [Bacteroides xylanisolvens]RHI64937.1 hypothetical protein DW158_22145 [Parabacteroides merd